MTEAHNAPAPHQHSDDPCTIVRANETHYKFVREGLADLHRRNMDEAAMQEFLADSRNYLLVAVVDNRVIGSLRGYGLQPPHRREPQFLLYEVDVRSECQKRGIGRALVRAFIDEARRAGASEMWVLTNESNQPAMAMYANCGLRRENADDVMLNLLL
jgi:ribosomal protein S18 acetylase RimI-like enzyme